MDVIDELRAVGAVLVLLLNAEMEVAVAVVVLLSTRISRGMSGLQLKHRPLRTLPSRSSGSILKSFFLKHFWPHVTHSPRFLRLSSNSCLVMTDPVTLKSRPRESMLVVVVVVVDVGIVQLGGTF